MSFTNNLTISLNNFEKNFHNFSIQALVHGATIWWWCLLLDFSTYLFFFFRAQQLFLWAYILFGVYIHLFYFVSSYIETMF